jgi:hypothetical protein
MKLVTSLGTESEQFEWDLGWELAMEILSGINLLSRNQNMKRLDGEGWKLYWAGDILRLDIERKEVT